jgi:hypothetical protein
MKKKSEEELTEAEVRRLLQEANLNQLNIFHDRNAIIARLCRSLLKSWNKDPYRL